MNVLLNHCDTVKMACLAQLVNVIAPIITKENGGLYRQTIFYPFAFASNNASGVTLKTSNDSGYFDSVYGKAQEVNQAITFNQEKHEVSLFVCNYSGEEKEISIDLSSFGAVELISSQTMHRDDLFEINDFDKQEVKPEYLKAILSGQKLSFIANKYSYNFIKIKTK